MAIAGQTFGRLTAIHRSGTTPQRGAIWMCQCDCGNHSEIRASNLQSGATKSCGCLRRETSALNGRAGAASTARAMTVHGHASTGKLSRTYQSWVAMKNRCTYRSQNQWKDYGGRGIEVCDRWLNSFENFLADMGERPADKTLDRKDNNGNYEPGNCRWATWKEQRANRRENKSKD